MNTAAHSPFRLMVVVGGAALIFGCALVAWGANWAFYKTFPIKLAYTRNSLVIPFLPLTALGVSVAGYYWRRIFHASGSECIAALIVVELIVLGLVAWVAEIFNEVTLLFWGIISAAFAPWWLLGIWLGRTGKGRPTH